MSVLKLKPRSDAPAGVLGMPSGPPPAKKTGAKMGKATSKAVKANINRILAAY